MSLHLNNNIIGVLKQSPIMDYLQHDTEDMDILSETDIWLEDTETW